ncbi:MAG: hypothetical protein H6534_01040 [Chthonomonadaceae bacterium]|nr:hypothetical protein [Chthonomonadaceae bacterium]
MTARERLTAASRGGPTDRRAVLLWPSGSRSDAEIVPVDEVGAALSEDPDRMVLAHVLSPFGRALADGFPLNELLTADPVAGQRKLEGYLGETRQDLHTAMEFGADGVFYQLEGAHPAAATPMQYGGFYLELDRALLGEVGEARLNVMYVAGGPEPYLDFVADLPAHLFAWDVETSGIAADAVRPMRKGALAASDPAAEVLFADDWVRIQAWAENGSNLETTHV